jgi:hypothetical protein
VCAAVRWLSVCAAVRWLSVEILQVIRAMTAR